MEDLLTTALQIRIAKAVSVAKKDGTTDGAHHKMWAIDQMVRVLLGCPEVEEQLIDAHGKPFIAKRLGESAAYLNFVGNCDGWDVGEAP